MSNPIMRTPHPLPAPTALSLVAAVPQDRDDIDFRSVLDSLFNARRLILSVTAAATLAGAGYALLSQPVYEADTLIQVEQNQGESSNHALGELASVFNIQSPATAEMEILRSRLVVGEASDALQLYVDASPNYLPVVGRWLAKRAAGLSDREPFGIQSEVLHWGGYVWGNEAIRVGHLDVPEELENQKLTLVASESGYDLRGPHGERLASGTVGREVAFRYGGGSGRVLIEALAAEPGSRFTLVRHSRQNVIEDLQTKLVIDEKSKPSGVLSMRLDGTDPGRIAAILNAIGAAYVRQNTERKAAEAEKSLAFLDGFLPELKKQMDAADNRYTAFRDEHGTFDLGTEGNLSLNTSVAMQTQLFELQQRRRELSAQFGPDHPTIRAVDEQISAVQKQVARLSSHIKTLPELEQRLLNLRRDAKVNSELYASLLNSTQQLRLVKEGKVGNVRVVDAAVPPERPIRPNRPLALAIAAALGLLLGTGLALLRNLFRSGVKGANDIESQLGMDVFATVPRIQPAASRRMRSRRGTARVLAQLSPDDPAVESLRSLRTMLRSALQEAPNNIVMLTGPTPNIGKTFTSVNLAAVCGAADKRVLLIDADFRSGGVHRYFGLPRDKGLNDLIHNRATVSDAVHRSVMPNVDLITTGSPSANPAETLLSDHAAQWLRTLSEQYDVVVLDTAPVLPVSDAMALAPLAGTVFMLARAEVTTLDELDESARRLNQAGAQVKGVILNDFNPDQHRFSTAYGRYRQRYLPYGSGHS